MFFLSWLTFPLLLALAIYTLRRTRGPAQDMTAADRTWRLLAVAALGLFVAGFGLCGAFGTVAGLMGMLGSGANSGEARAYGVMFLGCGLFGLGLAGLGAWVLRRYRQPGPASAAPDPGLDREP
jgi:hypothetical protein